MIGKKIAWHALFWGLQLLLTATMGGAGLAVIATYDAGLTAMNGVELRSWCAGINLACMCLLVSQLAVAFILGICDPKTKPLLPILAVTGWGVYALLGLVCGAIEAPHTETGRTVLLWLVRGNGVLIFSGFCLHQWATKAQGLPAYWRLYFSTGRK